MFAAYSSTLFHVHAIHVKLATLKIMAVSSLSGTACMTSVPENSQSLSAPNANTVCLILLTSCIIMS